MCLLAELAGWMPASLLPLTQLPVPGEGQELAYDPNKRSSGRPLVPLPYLLFLASFNSDAKNSEASTLLPEGDA